ncbi:MAG TPA: amidohydrolase family protein, partial [Mycobacteriales bacterium]|nr:amidohydrolase family protein [Mycobacteriales bacterium]
MHGVVDGPLDRAAFELLMNEGGMPAPPGLTHFDSPVGLAVRMRCAPLLGLEPGCDADDYLQARAELGVDEVNQRFLQASGLAAMLVETGHRGGDVVSPRTMARLSGRPAYEVTRIERLAEDVAGQVDSPGHWADAVGTALADAAATSIGFKTIVAYRYGFDLDVGVPTRDEVARAADAWFRTPSARLDSPVLLRHVLHTAVEASASARIPMQAHAGFGDTDLTLHRVDPSVFTPWVREFGARRVQLIFLHCYPYQRQAGYLAAVFPHVSFDVGCMFHYLGAGSTRTLAEAMELASWTKLLYSSDAFGLPEFVYLGSLLFRRALQTVLRGWVAAGDCTEEIADEIRVAICAGNARR